MIGRWLRTIVGLVCVVSGASTAHGAAPKVCPSEPYIPYEVTPCDDRDTLLRIGFDYDRVDVIRAIYDTRGNRLVLSEEMSQVVKASPDTCFAPSTTATDLLVKAQLKPLVVEPQPVLFRRARSSKYERSHTFNGDHIPLCSQDSSGCVIYIEPLPQGAPCR
jgi:hypothetical protein